jgi:hypothetical protein
VNFECLIGQSIAELLKSVSSANDNSFVVMSLFFTQSENLQVSSCVRFFQSVFVGLVTIFYVSIFFIRKSFCVCNLNSLNVF